MSYAEDAKTLATEIAFWFQALTDPTYPISELGKVSEELVQRFRALAIMLLLSEASTDLFLHNLMRSGRARLAYLSRLRQEGVAADFYQASGRYSALFSAIAASDSQTADEIVALSPDAALPGE